MDSIHVTVLQVLFENTGVNILNLSHGEQSRLSPDLGLDSIELVQLAQDLEERLGVEIPDSTIRANMTVSELVEAVRSLTK